MAVRRAAMNIARPSPVNQQNNVVNATSTQNRTGTIIRPSLDAFAPTQNYKADTLEFEMG